MATLEELSEDQSLTFQGLQHLRLSALCAFLRVMGCRCTVVSLQPGDLDENSKDENDEDDEDDDDEDHH